MKDANNQSKSTSPDDGKPAQSNILGTIENSAGKMVGCEGMVDEGGQRMTSKAGIEEQSGTG